MVHSSLRDEMVWRDGSAAADGWKPTATFGGRSATKAKNQKSPERSHTRLCVGSTQPTYGFLFGLVNWSAFKVHQMLNLGLALIHQLDRLQSSTPQIPSG
jgi:hypothetical protein